MLIDPSTAQALILSFVHACSHFATTHLQWHYARQMAWHAISTELQQGAVTEGVVTTRYSCDKVLLSQGVAQFHNSQDCVFGESCVYVYANIYIYILDFEASISIKRTFFLGAAITSDLDQLNPGRPSAWPGRSAHDCFTLLGTQLH